MRSQSCQGCRLVNDVAGVVGSIYRWIATSSLRLLSQARRCARTTRVLGLPLHIVNASSERDLDAVFETLVQLRAAALISCCATSTPARSRCTTLPTID